VQREETRTIHHLCIRRTRRPSHRALHWRKKLAELTVPAVNAFADRLRASGRSADMMKRVVRSLGAIFKEARRRGLSAVAPTEGLELDLPERDDPRPVIPTKPELQAIIGNSAGRWRPLILVATFCGLRASELRGLFASLYR
jgi:integrase